MDYSAYTKKWDDFHAGDFEEVGKTITEADVVLWCGMVADFNPMHLDKEYGKTTRFGDVIVPGVLVAGMISAAVTKACFGHVYLQQSLQFKKPVYIGDTITARATVLEKVEDKHAVRLSTVAVNQKGEVVIEGEGMEYILREKKPSA